VGWKTEEPYFDSRKGARVFFFHIHNAFGVHPASYTDGTGTRHLHLMYRVGMNGTVPPLLLLPS